MNKRGMGFSSRQKRKVLRKLNSFAFGFVRNHINFHSAQNAVYCFGSLLKTIIFCSLTKRHLENGIERLKELARFSVPDADTVHRRIKRKSFDEILGEFFKVQNAIILWLRKARKLPRSITVFIDEHDIRWFGKKENVYIVKNAKLKGTSSCFRYITINTVVNDYRICLYALPVHSFSRKDKLVDRLLTEAEKQFRIRLVLFDRGFSKDSKVLKVVEKHGLKYLAPKPKDERIKRLIEGADRIRLFYHPHYIFGKEEISTNLFFIPNGKQEKQIWENYHAFCTNIAIDESNMYALADSYGRRWNIENFYRDVQDNFMIRTKTAKPEVRLFFFLFSSVLYNLWYFVRGFVHIRAERWKDTVTDLLMGGRDIGYSPTYYGKISERLMKTPGW